VIGARQHDRVKLNRITSPQSDQSGGREINIDVSCLNHNGGSENDFRDKPAAIDGSLSMQHAETSHLR